MALPRPFPISRSTCRCVSSVGTRISLRSMSLLRARTVVLPSRRFTACVALQRRWSGDARNHHFECAELGAIAARVEITVWSKEVGADFLIARTGRTTELDAALSLSELLGGLPLAHEQAAAYCERTGCGIASYASKFAVAPERSWMIQRPHPNNITTD